jgi:hypothetical protein
MSQLELDEDWWVEHEVFVNIVRLLVTAGLVGLGAALLPWLAALQRAADSAAPHDGQDAVSQQPRVSSAVRLDRALTPAQRLRRRVLLAIGVAAPLSALACVLWALAGDTWRSLPVSASAIFIANGIAARVVV